MGLFDFLLGSGGSETTTTKNSIYTPEQEALLKQLTGKAEAGLTTGAPSYPGQTYAAQNPYESAYLGYNTGARQQAIQSLMSGQPAYDTSPEATEQYFNKTIKPAYQTQFFGDSSNPGTLALLEQQFAGPSYWSSNRANQTSNAIQNYGTTLSSKKADLMYQDELARRTALENAMGRKATGVTQDIASETAAGTAGAYARSIEQEKIASDLQRWLAGESVGGVRSDVYNPYNQLALAILGLTPYAYGENTETEGPGLLTGLMGGLGQGAGQAAGAKMFS